MKGAIRFDPVDLVVCSGNSVVLVCVFGILVVDVWLEASIPDSPNVSTSTSVTWISIFGVSFTNICVPPLLVVTSMEDSFSPEGLCSTSPINLWSWPDLLLLVSVSIITIVIGNCYYCY